MARLRSGLKEGGTPTFDNVEDPLTFERLHVFDFDAMRAYPSLIEPLPSTSCIA